MHIAALGSIAPTCILKSAQNLKEKPFQSSKSPLISKLYTEDGHSRYMNFYKKRIHIGSRQEPMPIGPAVLLYSMVVLVGWPVTKRGLLRKFNDSIK